KAFKDLIVIARGASYADVEAVASGFETGRPDNYAEVSDPEMDRLLATLRTQRGDARGAATKMMGESPLEQVYDVPMPQKFDLAWWTTRFHNWRNTAAYGNVGSGNPDQMWVSS